MDNLTGCAPFEREVKSVTNDYCKAFIKNFTDSAKLMVILEKMRLLF